MRVSLPQPARTSRSPRERISKTIVDFQKYRAARLAENVEKLIHVVAMDPAVSLQVTAKLKSELPAAHREFSNLCAVVSAAYLLSLLASGYLSAYLGSPWFVLFVCLMLTVEYFILGYYRWRYRYTDAYIADYLIRALEIGLIYRDTPKDARLRDLFAASIQRVAIKYCTTFKRSASTRFFAAQVRSQARNCRNDIVSLMPGLVTARQNEIDSINSDLVRLLIRTQTGYWYQTRDITRHGMAIPRRSAFSIGLRSAFTDRPIQVALISTTGTLLVSIIGSVISHLK